MKVPLLSLVATETEELRSGVKENSFLFVSPFWQYLWGGGGSYSRHDLCVVDQVLQGVAAGEVVIEVCGVADQPLIRSGCVYIAGDYNRLDA